jgi:hypothetical protein
MTFEEIVRLYSSACGEAPAAYAERWLHITDAYRKVCAKLDLQQLEEDVSVLTTTAGVDWVALPTAVFHVLSLHNTSAGFPVQPEPSGMRGRERYLDEDTGIPSEGIVRYYAVTAQRIYLRQTPDDVYELNLRYKIQPTAISDSDLASSPATPSQWDMAIIAGAAASFMRLHPDTDASYGEGQLPRSVLLDQAADKATAEIPLPKGRELFDQRSRMYIPVFLRTR